MQARIISYSADYYFMEVGIIEEIKDSISMDTIVVSGQDGMNCALSFHKELFDISDTVILRLTNDFYNRKDTFELSDCSLNYLRFENDYVKGNINNTDTVLGYQEFKSFYTGPIINSIERPSKINEINVYPNPASEVLHIDLYAHAPFDIRIYDLSGRLITQLHSYDGRNLDISDLKQGVYILQCIDSNGIPLLMDKLLLKK